MPYYAPYWWDGSRLQSFCQALATLYSWKGPLGRGATAGTAALVMVVWLVIGVHQTHIHTVTVCSVTTVGKDFQVYTAHDGTFTISDSYWLGSYDVKPADRYDQLRRGEYPGTYRIKFIGTAALWGYPNILRANRVANDTAALADCHDRPRSQSLSPLYFGTKGGAGFGLHHLHHLTLDLYKKEPLRALF
jgi:hypothetical protein